MKRILISLSLFTAVSVQASETANNTVTTFIESNSYSNIIPISELIKEEWETRPTSDSSRAYSFNKGGLRYRYGDFRISAVHRTDYWARTNEDTAEVFYIDQNDLGFDESKEYNLDLWLYHQRSNGVTLGYFFDAFDWQIMVEAGYWDINAVMDSRLSGVASGRQNGDILGDVKFEERYTEHNILKRPHLDDWDTDGYGYNFNLHLSSQLTETVKVDIQLNDIFSEFTIEGLGYSDGTIGTDNDYIDGDGFLSFLPLYRGKESSEDYSFKLPEYLKFDLTYRPIDASIYYTSSIRRQGQINFLWLGAGYAFETVQVEFSLDVDHVTPAIQIKHNNLSFVLGMDKLDIDEAMQIDLGLNFNIIF